MDKGPELWDERRPSRRRNPPVELRMVTPAFSGSVEVLRFAEATNRLDLSEQGGRPLTEIFQKGFENTVENVAHDIAKDKTEDVIETVKEAATAVKDSVKEGIFGPGEDSGEG